MTAGQVWRRDDGLTWVEVQAPTVDPSGWRLMVPLVAPDEAVQAPPLVVDVGRWRARAHLVTATPPGRLGTEYGTLTVEDTAALQQAVRSLIVGPG